MNDIKLPPMPNLAQSMSWTDDLEAWARKAVELDRQSRADPVGHAMESLVDRGYTIATFNADRVPAGAKLYTVPVDTSAQDAERIAKLEQANAELERLCDATYVAKGADAYNHSCDVMEEWQKKRMKQGKDVGTTGSLCDGIAWLYEHIEELESSQIDAAAIRNAALEEAIQVILDGDEKSLEEESYMWDVDDCAEAIRALKTNQQEQK